MAGPSLRPRKLAIIAIVVGAATVLIQTRGYAGDTPAGFYYGIDSCCPTATGSSPQFQEPDVTGGGSFSTYLDEIGGYEQINGCNWGPVHNDTDIADADADHVNNGAEPGDATYFFLGGPGADPSYNGTTSEAQAWGQRQAEFALNEIFSSNNYYPMNILWGDFEDTETASHGPYYGWNEHAYSCANGYYSWGISTAVDRATFNGFWNDLVYNHGNAIEPGAYSSNSNWSFIFGSNGTITGTWEWAANWPNCVGSNCDYPNPTPYGFCIGGNCASFFGSQTYTSSKALIWQWAGGAKDYDQVDTNHIPSYIH